MAQRLIDQFDSLDLDAIIINSAGCGSVMKDYGALLADDPVYAERACRFSDRVRDAAEFLAELPIRFPAGLDKAKTGTRIKVTYHDACHLAHGQKVRRAPRALLEQMAGVELLELPEADWCCGSAGIYNLTQPEMAAQLGERKVRNILSTGAEVVVSGNPGCSLQIARGLKSVGSSVRVMHTMDLLATAYPDPVPGLEAYRAAGWRAAGTADANGARIARTREEEEGA